ncbi:glycosyltransferase N-terminal domain-containing protein [Paracoccus sp. 1_MG-2023]|uniref:3-deoxy-D-manno-octulosonic acid transferase n=1 Tax=unclassified Paracoccus (in: a-proteobacteria) TaxID=2688777 RepID=UPI001C0A36A9|nr:MULTISPECIES: glycosyltransferase N-terminal domain-containing protein [unclassified Paracoccus (in: a-proteobacteria)]MBU2957116.1 3-deoxy-D-manno-octulosonic acid transferase [Paracoccus sp. C2R09]MDO6669550.1 glycosyltransferase N-terminal domain-containing protein [Paracoccus sp. 1_MG-2023]
MPRSGLGRLGLWWQLRQARDQAQALPRIPEGAGAVLLLHVAPDARQAEAQVRRRLMQSRPGLRIVDLHPEDDGVDPALDPALIEALIARTRPQAVLAMGSALPAALIAGAARHDIPVILSELRLEPRDLAWGMQAGIRRQLLSRAQALLMTDAASHAAARRMGLPAWRLHMTGPVSEIREPLHCSEPERAVLAALITGRHAWFAAGLPEPEEDAVIAAHQEVVHHSHRALLFIAPADPARIPELARKIEGAGLILARRDEDEEPTEEIQVMLTDGPTEMGLWYRLAPVSFMGGTMSGGSDTRHPFEPAALGSAIVHGTESGAFQTEWQQLDGAHAARRVTSPESLAAALVELTQAELAATLAANAWRVSTGGADVAIRIADRVLGLIDGSPPSRAIPAPPPPVTTPEAG